ncbi:peptidoglycan-binding domain-containing protein [Nocardioides speluncae]|uniref:peptidoglycan-binding domain-containing protein n=1 Tax=Nocardioides speluncae TaxID=2670337 RepID=UPI000D68E085|nr:peptidoglycan-binding domain-containing protein [Nocardioides speluncae]
MRSVSGRTAAILAGMVLVGGGGGWLVAHDRGEDDPPGPSASPTDQPSESLSLQVFSCDALEGALIATFVLQDDDSAPGEELFPRVTVRNEGEVDVLVALQGSAAAGPDSTVEWPADDSPLAVAAGDTRSRTLGGGDGTTLTVAAGQSVTEVTISGTAEAASGRPADCLVTAERASTAVVPVCLDVTPPAARPYPGVPLSTTSGTDLVDDVKALQQQLNTLGGECTVIDGIFGRETRRIVREFQRTSGLRRTGIVDKETWDAIFAAS